MAAQEPKWRCTRVTSAWYLSRLVLTDFRSYAAVDLRLERGVSTLIGANGEGKTNVVEAVGYLATLNSPRVAR